MNCLFLGERDDQESYARSLKKLFTNKSSSISETPSTQNMMEVIESVLIEGNEINERILSILRDFMKFSDNQDNDAGEKISSFFKRMLCHNIQVFN